MTQMNKRISKIPNDVQDRNSIAWKKLCEYIEDVAKKGNEDFIPSNALGNDLFSQIYTLPESISKLKKVKKMVLYGSNLKRIPPEIGEMESLEIFVPYTSYDLHWFPYEITRCKKINDSTISTRALYGNYKNRMDFPTLDHNPVKYFGDNLKCSVCQKELTYETTNQMWITAYVGTDTIPMLTNLCSKECEQNLQKPSENYVQYPHKGGADLIQPLGENELWEIEISKREKTGKQNKNTTEQSKPAKEKSEIVEKENFKFPLIKFVREIWKNK